MGHTFRSFSLQGNWSKLWKVSNGFLLRYILLGGNSCTEEREEVYQNDKYTLASQTYNWLHSLWLQRVRGRNSKSLFQGHLNSIFDSIYIRFQFSFRKDWIKQGSIISVLFSLFLWKANKGNLYQTLLTLPLIDDVFLDKTKYKAHLMKRK